MTREDILAQAVERTKTLPKQTVARQLAQDYPQYFSSIDQARSAIRLRTGAFGEKCRHQAVCKEVRISTIAEGLAKLQGYERVREDVIHLLDENVGVINDVHCPYHDFGSVKVALESLKAPGITVLLLNGDIIDNYQLSKFPKDSSRPTFSQELACVRAFLQLVRDEFPKARLIYKFGNHEIRLRTYIQSKAAELEGVLELEKLLHLEEIGYEVVKHERIALGKLNVLHGHELPHGISAPVNPARGVFLKAKKSCIVGHHHQTSHHSEGDIEGGRTGCWSVGCLCDLSPDYNYFGGLKWNHGFARVEVDSAGMFTVFNHSIIEGKVH